MTPEQLRASILQQAMEGKLVKQDPNDEPASVLLEKIAEEKARLIREKKIKRTKKLPEITDDEKPFEIPDSWEWVRITDLANITMGQAPKSNYVNTKKVGNEFHQGKSFFGKKIIQESDKYTELDNKLISPNSIVMAVRAPVGNVNITNRTIYVGRGLAGIEPFSGVDLNFLFSFLRTRKSSYETQATGSTFKAINGDIVRKTCVPLPPFDEQKRIVAKIDQIMPLVDEYAEAYDKLKKLDDGFNDKLKQSLLQYAMEGKLVKQDPNDEPASVLLEKIAEEKARLIREKKIKRTKKLPEITDDEKPFEIPDSWEWVRLITITNFGNFKSVNGLEIPDDAWLLDMKDMNKNGGGFRQLISKNEVGSVKSNKYVVTKNDVLYGKLRPYLKKVEIAPQPGYTTTEIFPIHTIANLTLATYLRYCLLSPYFVDTVNSSMYGMKMPRVGTKFLGSMSIPLPPLAEQKRIVAKLDQLMAVIH